MRIALGSDHAGFEYKEAIAAHLKRRGHSVTDFGAYSNLSTDYPVFVIPAAEAVVRGEADRAIVLGGSGNGEAIAANKVKGIRCGVCSDTFSARMIRQHNDANMLSLGARVVGEGLAFDIVDAFLTAEFEGGRHATRVDMIEG